MDFTTKLLGINAVANRSATDPSMEPLNMAPITVATRQKIRDLNALDERLYEWVNSYNNLIR